MMAGKKMCVVSESYVLAATPSERLAPQSLSRARQLNSRVHSPSNHVDREPQLWSQVLVVTSL